MIVYLIRNTATGECYVGKTSRPLWHRWSQHRAEARLNRKDTPLYRALRTYQLHCFETEVLGEAPSSRRIAQMERKFIRIFDAVESGYNMNECSRGGRIRFKASNAHAPKSAEQRRKNSESNRQAWAAKKAVAQ